MPKIRHSLLNVIRKERIVAGELRGRECTGELQRRERDETK
jgi:hypothetical protein